MKSQDVGLKAVVESIKDYTPPVCGPLDSVKTSGEPLSLPASAAPEAKTTDPKTVEAKGKGKSQSLAPLMQPFESSGTGKYIPPSQQKRVQMQSTSYAEPSGPSSRQVSQEKAQGNTISKTKAPIKANTKSAPLSPSSSSTPSSQAPLEVHNEADFPRLQQNTQATPSAKAKVKVAPSNPWSKK